LIQIPLPPLPAQREIVARLEKELGEADALAAKFKGIAENADAEFNAELDETFKNVEGEKVRLGDVCQFQRGLTYKKSDEVAQSDNIVLRSNNIDLEKGTLDLSELKYIREDFFVPADKKVMPGSILMCMANGSKSHLGKVALVQDDLGYAFGGFMGLLVPEGIDSSYLYFVLRSALFKECIRMLQDGANINNLKFADFCDFQIPLPSISVQRAIVAKLESAKLKCEKLKVVAERGLRAAENLRKSILAEAFEQ
jgi:restriction endonuclease S subunit